MESIVEGVEIRRIVVFEENIPAYLQRIDLSPC